LIAALTLLFLVTPAARADRWTNYLQIECDAALGNFSVRPRGAPVEAGTPLPPTWLETQRGADGDGASPDNAPVAEQFAVCAIPGSYGPGSEPLLFEVLRTSVSQPATCGGCGSGSAQFEIRLNGRLLAKGQVGHEQAPPIATVLFNGAQLFVCETAPSWLRNEDHNGRSNLTCSAGYLEEFMR